MISCIWYTACRCHHIEEPSIHEPLLHGALLLVASAHSMPHAELSVSSIFANRMTLKNALRAWKREILLGGWIVETFIRHVIQKKPLKNPCCRSRFCDCTKILGLVLERSRTRHTLSTSISIPYHNALPKVIQDPQVRSRTVLIPFARAIQASEPPPPPCQNSPNSSTPPRALPNALLPQAHNL